MVSLNYSSIIEEIENLSPRFLGTKSYLLAFNSLQILHLINTELTKELAMTQEPKSQFNFMPILLIAITVIVISIGSYLSFRGTKEDTESSDANPSLVDSPEGENTSVNAVFGEFGEEGEEPGTGLLIELSDGSPQDQSVCDSDIRLHVLNYRPTDDCRAG